MTVRFLKDQASWLLMWGLILSGAALLFWGYRVEVEAFVWLFLFSLLVLGVQLGVQYSRWKKTMRALESCRQDPERILKLPSSEVNHQVEEMRLDLQEHAAGLQVQLELGQKEQDDYYTLWTHQAKLPLSTLQLLLEQEKPPVREARKQVQRLDHYLNMVLAYQRMNSQNTDLHFEWWNLDDSIRTVLRSFFSDCYLRHLSVDFEPTDFQVLSDRKWLEFVLEQLLSNAVKYAAGTIRIGMQNGTLCIEDDGPGIAPEDIHRIYQKGFTGSATRLDAHSSGLGLYLVAGALKQLHHSLHIESSAAGGTRVFLRLDRDISRHPE